ncbi:MAG TPA: aminodeoxychorismate synthase component I [Candidatus Binatia bacterium]|nr:aminodeoxychorismate synthase component I [Candidatus Binatia bacterium]
MGTDSALLGIPALRAGACVRALPEWLTPLRALAAVEDAPHTVLFESGGATGAASEWTLLAFDPPWRLEVAEGALWEVREGHRARRPGLPLEALAAAWPCRAEIENAPPAPFLSGLAGAIAYDFKDWIERYPARARRERPVPDLSLGFYDCVWAWRRSTGEGWCVSTGLAESDPRRRDRRAGEFLETQWSRVAAGGAGDVPGSESVVRAGAVRSNFTRESYGRMVEVALEHIAAGDIYQVNLSQRFLVDTPSRPAALYRSLRAAAPAPFLAFLSLENGGVASSSPERFFRVQGRRIETWPIKGTRPRGATPEEDAALRLELIHSDKDRAENVMIVDLERNDLGRVCAIGSVAVPALCEIASHSNVHHFESRVVGDLREDATPVDILRALFPGGSITGTPKIRSVQIIDRLEPVRRGIYTGALGYWDVRGDCDWNIAIRTIVAGGGAASFHVGGGIVADSTPEGEYEETLVKASGMMRALGVRAPV